MRRRFRFRLVGSVVLALFILGALSAAWVARNLRMRTADVSLKRSPPDPGAIWISHVNVFDGELLLRDQDVAIHGTTIAAVNQAGTQPAPQAALQIDGRGHTLLPGLIDMHAHLLTSGAPPWKVTLPDVPASAHAMLYAGVTSALVAVSSADEEQLQSDSAAGRAAAPHLFLAGPSLTAKEGHPIPFLRALLPWPLSALLAAAQPTAATPDEARVQVERIFKQHHPPLFKIFYDDIPDGSPHLSHEALLATVAAVRERGMRPIVHIGSSADMLAAAEAGVALLMHPPSKDTLSDAQIARLKAIGTPFVTTLRMPLAADEVGHSGGSRLERESVDARALNSFAEMPIGWQLKGFEGMEQAFPQVAARMRDNVRRLVQAGVPFYVGTDAGVFGVFPGASLHGEILELVHSGLPANVVLRAATSAPAAFLDPKHTFGKVVVGQRADLLLVRGDPLENLAALSDIEEVFLSGSRVLRKPLIAK